MRASTNPLPYVIIHMCLFVNVIIHALRAGYQLMSTCHLPFFLIIFYLPAAPFSFLQQFPTPRLPYLKMNRLHDCHLNHKTVGRWMDCCTWALLTGRFAVVLQLQCERSSPVGCRSVSTNAVGYLSHPTQH